MRALIAQADSLNSRIYSSLPWGYRLANLLLKLSVDTGEALGRTVHQLLSKAGTPDLPDNERTWGKTFGKSVMRIMMSKFGNLALVEEAASKLMMKIIQGKVRIDPTKSLKQAEALIKKSLINDILSLKRQPHRKREVGMPTDNEGHQMDLEDPGAWGDLGRVVTRSDWPKIERDLKKVHPRALSWVEAKLRGRNSKQIAEEWGVEPGYLSGKFKRNILPKIKEVFLNHFREAM